MFNRCAETDRSIFVARQGNIINIYAIIKTRALLLALPPHQNMVTWLSVTVLREKVIGIRDEGGMVEGEG